MPAQRGPFTVTETGIIWRCTRCDNDNPLDAQICSVCGTRFADILNPPRDRPIRDPNNMAMYSLFLPGAGHWQMDLKAQGAARAIVSAWVVMVALLAAIAGATVMAVVFGMAAFVLWMVAAHDAYREARGESQMVLLKPRVFVYLVLGLLMLMIVLLVSAGFRAGRA